jgi:hypothetical protein
MTDEAEAVPAPAPRRGGGRLARLGLSTLVLVLAVAAFLAAARTTLVPLGRPHRFDDTGYAVANVHRVDAIGDAKPERGRFLVVRLGIRNQSRAVDLKFRPEAVLVEDAAGRRYPVASGATRAHHRAPGSLPPCDEVIPAGKSCTTDLVFDVPADVGAPRLVIASDGGATEILGRIVAGKVRFALDDEGR